MKKQKLTETTKNHYEKLIGKIGNDYMYYRWKNHPIKRSHYMHTKKSIEYAFDKIVGKVDDLMEIGCGPGTWTDICLAHSTKTTVLDISDEMIRLIKNRYGSDFNINYVCGDYLDQKVNFTKKFDVIFSARALEYMSDKNFMIGKSCNYLKAGGYLIIITKNPLWRDKVFDEKKKIKGGSSKKTDIQSDWIYWEKLSQFFLHNSFSLVKILPVCIGSYYFPFNNFIGIKLCDLFYNVISNRQMTAHYNFITESYMIIGKKL
jgi:SAM-dependent methyltransferase